MRAPCLPPCLHVATPVPLPHPPVGLRSQRSYVVYPPEGPAPPAPDEMARLVGRERAREEARAVAAVAAATAADGGAGGGEGVGKPPRVQR